jgi:hypothetical protein
VTHLMQFEETPHSCCLSAWNSSRTDKLPAADMKEKKNIGSEGPAQAPFKGARHIHAGSCYTRRALQRHLDRFHEFLSVRASSLVLTIATPSRRRHVARSTRKAIILTPEYVDIRADFSVRNPLPGAVGRFECYYSARAIPLPQRQDPTPSLFQCGIETYEGRVKFYDHQAHLIILPCALPHVACHNAYRSADQHSVVALTEVSSAIANPELRCGIYLALTKIIRCLRFRHNKPECSPSTNRCSGHGRCSIPQHITPPFVSSFSTEPPMDSFAISFCAALAEC